MENNDVKRSLMNKVTDLMKRYGDISFRYVYDSGLGVFLVSYHPGRSLLENESFWDDLFNLKQSLRDEFEDLAPLFSEDDTTFLLPDNACQISINSSSESFDVSYSSRMYIIPVENSMNVFYPEFSNYTDAA